MFHVHRMFLLLSFMVLIATVHASPADRRTKCHSDSDCVQVKIHNQQSQLLVDQLNFDTDGPEELLKAMPGWFGPRPAVFVYKGKKLGAKDTFSGVGIQLAEVVTMYKEEEWSQQADL